MRMPWIRRTFAAARMPKTFSPDRSAMARAMRSRCGHLSADSASRAPRARSGSELVSGSAERTPAAAPREQCDAAVVAAFPTSDAGYAELGFVARAYMTVPTSRPRSRMIARSRRWRWSNTIAPARPQLRLTDQDARPSDP